MNPIPTTESVVRLSLDAVGDGTEVSLSQGEFATEARLALHRRGWTEGLERLRERIDSGT
ncbi:MAG: SRPBCC domain-containing protein [Nocardioidaceae bacterium]